MPVATITTTLRLDSDGDVVAVPAVRLWDVYQQQWITYALDSVPDAVLASLPQGDRDIIDGAA